MSQGNIPYHLRPNKAVERNIFIDLLSMINGYDSIDIREYAYIGLGGPYLEDFKSIHGRFGTYDMYSLESNPIVYERQKFNSPLKCIDLKPITCREFIDAYPITKNAIIWLDYSTPEIYDQLVEFQNILVRTVEKDIIKITFNADPRTLGDPPLDSLIGLDSLEQEEELRKFRLEIFKDRLSDFFPQGTEPDMMKSKNMADALIRSLHIAVDRALINKKDSFFQLLSLFSYGDSGTTMLTATGIILRNNRDTIEDFLFKTHIGDWPLGRTNWGPTIRINVPDLTVKERVYLDSLLPPDKQDKKADIKNICRSLSFINKSQIENYIEYYRFYPYFSKVIL